MGGLSLWSFQLSRGWREASLQRNMACSHEKASCSELHVNIFNFRTFRLVGSAGKGDILNFFVYFQNKYFHFVLWLLCT